MYDFLTGIVTSRRAAWHDSNEKGLQPRGFNISNALRKNYAFPAAGYIDLPDTGGYIQYEGTDYVPEQKCGQYKVYKSSNEESPQPGGWQIQGASFGVRYIAAPRLTGSLRPLRIRVVIPDQVDWPAELWNPLDARDSVHIRGPHVQGLGISQHLCKALGSWCSRFDDFRQTYNNMPFASLIRVENITANISEMRMSFVPRPDYSALTSSSRQLQVLWNMRDDEMPPVVELKHLRLEREIADDVALVRIPSHDEGRTMFAFKSSSTRFSAVYHELKTLLALKPHRNIIPRPLCLVVERDESTGAERVLGFLLKYFPLGSLYDILPRRREAGTLKLETQLHWGIDVTSSLIHVLSEPAEFYSDLRTDNVLLAVDEASQTEIAVLIDFEQGRNLYNWAPPEIYRTEWIAEMGHKDFARAKGIPQEVRNKYHGILTQILSVRKYPLPLAAQPDIYDNAPQGWYFPWLMSTRLEKEAGMVYLLGKLLYCIFEGRANTDIVLGQSYVGEQEQQFPEFRLTPPPLQNLIKCCTCGAREWLNDPIRIYRRGGKVFPFGQAGLHGQGEATLQETQEAIVAFWREEMKKAEDFVLARYRHDKGEATEDDMKLLHYLHRPTLAEVHRQLVSYSETLIPLN